MARRLSARWVRLADGRDAEYLATLRIVKAGVLRAGGHFWLFRHPVLRDVFLEFRERPGDPPPATDQDAALAAAERRLLELAEYTPDAEVSWEEISLEDR
jgi:hypothetical protein